MSSNRRCELKLTDQVGKRPAASSEIVSKVMRWPAGKPGKKPPVPADDAVAKSM